MISALLSALALVSLGCGAVQEPGVPNEAPVTQSEQANRLIHETSPYLLQHAHNPVDWYPWGPEALERAQARGQADLPLDRLLGLPLVPRDGARELRERGDRAADERALRQHQGRPRGAARPRRDLHEGRAGADRRGRLADERVPHARARAVLRRHVLPAATRATAGRASPTCSLASREAWQNDRASVVEQGRAAGRSASRDEGARRRARRARRRTCSIASLARCSASFDRDVGRLRRRAEVPARARPAAAAPRTGCARRTRRRCAIATHTLDRMAERRHLRSARRRLPPLQHRRALADPALREDALRQRAARARATSRRYLRHRRRGVRARRARVLRVGAARDDHARGRLRERAGRRQRGRGGQVLRLDAGRARRGARREARRVGRGVVRRHRRGQLRARHERAVAPRAAPNGRARSCGVDAGELDAAMARGARAAASPRARSACIPAPTTRCSRPGTG